MSTTMARPQYTTTATRSLMVVMSGPDATAGSIWILWNSMGMTVPTRLEMTIATMRETPTQPESRNACPHA